MEVEYPVYPDERSMEREENEMSNPSKSKGPAVNIQRSVYTMATTDGSSAEIVMYGDIYEEQPVHSHEQLRRRCRCFQHDPQPSA